MLLKNAVEDNEQSQKNARKRNLMIIINIIE